MPAEQACAAGATALVPELLYDDPPSLAQVQAGAHGCGVPGAGALNSG